MDSNTPENIPMVNPLDLLDTILKQLPKAVLPDLPPEIPLIADHMEGLIGQVENIAKELSPEHLAKLLDDKLLGLLVGLHGAVDDLEHTTLLDWFEDEWKDLLSAASGFVKAAEATVEQDSSALLSKIETMTTAMSAAAKHLDIQLPFDVATLLADSQKLIPKLPNIVLVRLKEVLVTDLSALKALPGKLVTHDGGLVIGLAVAAAVFRALSATLKLVIRALPLTLKFGLNLAFDGSAVGRGSAQADISAGADVGVGASVPIAGIGGDVGAGAGNASVFSTTPLKVSLTGLVLGPLAAGCDSTVAVLEAIIKIEKNRKKAS